MAATVVAIVAATVVAIVAATVVAIPQAMDITQPNNSTTIYIDEDLSELRINFPSSATQIVSKQDSQLEMEIKEQADTHIHVYWEVIRRKTNIFCYFTDRDGRIEVKYERFSKEMWNSRYANSSVNMINYNGTGCNTTAQDAI